MDPAATPRSVVAGAREPAASSQLFLLGGFRLRLLGVEVELPVGAQRLLALIALRGRSSRSRTAGTLWPLTTEERALANLRTAIWRVHHGAPAVLLTTPTTIDLGTRIVVDVHRLVAAADVLVNDELSRDDLFALWRATPHHAGELLPEWDGDWLIGDRQRMRQMQLHALELFAERFVAAGCYAWALDAALAALRADILRESAHRAVIRVHLAEGNAVEARRALEFCRRVLAREAGVEPSSTTTRLVLPRGPVVGSDVRR